ncbi:MAG: histidine phosphatase family protein, partial [Candidatus Binataceae bacterium]
LHLRFGDHPFNPVFASPLSRARESATVITGVTPIVIDEFAEVDFGAFEGLTADEIHERYPEDFTRWNRNRLDPEYAYPGGERRAAFIKRVNRGVAKMLERLDGPHQPNGANAIVVAHRGVIRRITQRLALAEPVIELGSIQSLIRTLDGGWRVELLDETAHLAGIA